MSTEAVKAVRHQPVLKKFRTLLIITAVLDGLYAVNLLFMPAVFLEMHGLNVSETALFATRLLAPAVLSDCLLALFVLNSQSWEAMRAVAFKFCVSWGIGGLVILIGKLTVASMSAAAWVDAGFALIFTVAYGYYLFTRFDAASF